MKLLITSLLVCICAAIAPAGPARAADPTTADCLAANESSIALRNQHKLRETRARLLICAAASCPTDIRDECIRRVAEVNASMPTIVFETKDAAGNDVSAVKVTMDGEPLVERLEGTALSIDPGSHAFVFTMAGQPAVQREFVIREGDKDRRERIVFGASAAVGADTVLLASPAATGTETSASGGLGGRRIGALVAAGVGVVGLGIGIGFGLSSMSKHDDAVAACPNQCADQKGVDLWNDARTAGNISTVGFVVGVAGLAGGAALWFLSRPESEKVPATQVGIGSGGVQLRGVW